VVAGYPVGRSLLTAVSADWAAGHDPRHALCLAVGKYIEFPEGVTQLIWAGTERSGTDTDLAVNRDRQQTTGRKAFDHGLIESLVSKQVADKKIHGWALRKTPVEIDHVEAATVGDAGERGQLVGEIDSDR